MLERIGDVLLGRRLARDQRGEREQHEDATNHFSRW
jgi:hypothetical protein